MKILFCLAVFIGSSFAGEIGMPVTEKFRDKHFYMGIHFTANYFEALEFCNYNGMRLATIQDQEENDALESFKIKYGMKKQFLWIGAADKAEEGYFVWISTGQPVTYHHFYPGQPDNTHHDEDCVEFIEDGWWNDQMCDKKNHFVCEY